MQKVLSLSVLTLTLLLSACGDEDPPLSRLTPAGPLPSSEESPAAPAPQNPTGGPTPRAGATPAPNSAPAAVACVNPFPKIGLGSPLANALLSPSAGALGGSWSVGTIEIFVESSDRDEQVLARTDRSARVTIECQNTLPKSTLAAYAFYPDAVMAPGGQYGSQLELTLGLDPNGIAVGQAAIVTPVLRGLPVFRKVQDFRAPGGSDNVKGVGGANLKVKLQKTDTILVRPGLVVVLTESEVEAPKGKFRVYTRAEYSL